MTELAGQVALITGAASGIGQAVARGLADAGARLALADIAPLEATREGLTADTLGINADVASEADARRMVEATVATFGQLDILVNSAGVPFQRPLLETTLADFERVIGVNLRGTFLVGRETLRQMQRQGSGRVINIASELAHLGRDEFSVYCASKGAVISLTRSWAREFAPHILVNAVAPGPVDTPLLDLEGMSPEWRARELAIPLARVGQPAEIAAMIVFLAGPGGSFITGQSLGVNGGAVMT